VRAPGTVFLNPDPLGPDDRVRVVRHVGAAVPDLQGGFAEAHHAALPRWPRSAAPAPPFLGGPVPGSTCNPADPRRNACLAQPRRPGQPPDRPGRSGPPGRPAEPTG